MLHGVIHACNIIVRTGAQTMGAVHATRRFQHGQPERQVHAWIAALDQRCVCNESMSWVIYVLGVHVDGGKIWIQISRDGDPDDTLVLRVPPEASTADALAALASAPHATESQPFIIDAPATHAGATIVKPASRVTFAAYPRLYRHARPR
jgi:hypothetical protein